MKNFLRLCLCLSVLFASVAPNQTTFAQNPQPIFRFSKKLFGSVPNGPSGLQCAPPVPSPNVFTVISGSNPNDTNTYNGICNMYKSTTFPGTTDSFRIIFDQSTLTYFKKLNDAKSKTMYTGGTAFIQHYNRTNSQWNTILKAGNFTIFLTTQCIPLFPKPTFEGFVIGDVDTTTGNSSFVNEFKAFGKSNQIKAKFIAIMPDTQLTKNSVLAFDVTLDIVPMPNINSAVIQALNIPGAGQVMNFLNTNTTINCNQGYKPLGDSTNKPSLTVCHYHSRDSVKSKPDTNMAGVYQKFWWLIGSNLDTNNFGANLCFKFNPKWFGKNIKINKLKNLLSACWQDDGGKKWHKILGAPIITIDSINPANSTICFTVTHFSNWSIAIDKPAPAKVVKTTAGNPTADAKALGGDTTLGFSVRYNLLAGQSDTVLFQKFAINPGGDQIDTSFTILGDSYFDLQSTRSNSSATTNVDGTVGFFIDTSVVPSKFQTILYRPDAASPWESLPTTRVRKGLKESMYIKPVNKSGQYATAESKTQTQEFTTTNVNIPDVCRDDTSKFNYTITGGVAPFAYELNFGDGSNNEYISSINSNVISTNHKYTNPANSYNTILEVWDKNNISFKYAKTANIINKPIAAFTKANLTDTIKVGIPFTFKNNSTGSGGLTYIWNFGDGTPVSNDLNPTHTFSNAGGHNISLIVVSSTGNCRDTLTQAMTAIISGLEEDLVNNSKLQIFPNPNSEKFINIKFTNVSTDHINVSVFDVIGKKVYSEQINNFSGIYEKHLDFNNNPKGIYLVKISDENTNYIQRVILQ